MPRLDRPSRRSTRAWGERGAAAIEFALVFPIFIMLTFGMISAGFAFFYDIQLTQAARDAARFGSTYPMQADCGHPDCVATGLDAVIEVAARQSGWDSAEPGDLTDNGYICVAYVGGGSGSDLSLIRQPSGATESPMPCMAATQTGPQVQVVIRRDSEINGVLFSWNVTLGTTAIIPWERRDVSI